MVSRADLPAWSWEREREARAARVPEDAAASRLALAWSCEFVRYADNGAIDWFCKRGTHIIGDVEIKCRKVALAAYPTIWLAKRKYVALRMSQEENRLGAVFVVSYNDALAWIDIATVKTEFASRVVLAGRTDRGLRNDVEPMIEIPVAALHRIRETVVRQEPEPI